MRPSIKGLLVGAAMLLGAFALVDFVADLEQEASQREDEPYEPPRRPYEP